jgi:hypothetical protein
MLNNDSQGFTDTAMRSPLVEKLAKFHTRYTSIGDILQSKT